MSQGRRGPLCGQVIALLGAESTGKTSMAAALCAHWAAKGIDAVVVGEYLRDFCALHGRTPRAQEQRDIMVEQTRRIAAAARQHAIVVTDTTALMTVAYSEVLFDDRSLRADALSAHAACAATLVMRPDLPWQDDGLFRDGPQARKPVDDWLITTLESSGVAYASVWGLGDARLECALSALAALAGAAHLVRAGDPMAG